MWGTGALLRANEPQGAAAEVLRFTKGTTFDATGSIIAPSLDGTGRRNAMRRRRRICHHCGGWVSAQYRAEYHVIAR
jgi:hypothetical protein